MSRPRLHYRLEDGELLCGGPRGELAGEPWDVDCPGCLAVARAESVDQPLEPHPFRHPQHCATCNITDPLRWARRDRPSWNGHW